MLKYRRFNYRHPVRGRKRFQPSVVRVFRYEI
uniref:Uncharacterized protein n=1 Tax=Siphoviridae sp. ctFH16 TaxID=2827817 RepID=A0A8S5TN81_9CAUD|nr:MAG TPA: hypothetical protein [Siphoviridae sp. ctFH16]